MSGDYSRGILYELVNDTDNAVSLFNRPRRFGKTLMMSMMENFINIRKDSKEIFDGLDIMDHADFCDKWMNKYPVLFLLKMLKQIVLKIHMGCMKDNTTKVRNIKNYLLSALFNAPTTMGSYYQSEVSHDQAYRAM